MEKWNVRSLTAAVLMMAALSPAAAATLTYSCKATSGNADTKGDTLAMLFIHGDGAAEAADAWSFDDKDPDASMHPVTLKRNDAGGVLAMWTAPRMKSNRGIRHDLRFMLRIDKPDNAFSITMDGGQEVWMQHYTGTCSLEKTK